jgi:hypothetical protein
MCEGIVVLENAAEFPIDILKRRFDATHEVKSAIFGPDLLW